MSEDIRTHNEIHTSRADHLNNIFDTQLNKLKIDTEIQADRIRNIAELANDTLRLQTETRADAYR